MSFLLHVHADYIVHLVFDHARHWVRKKGLTLHIWLLQPPFLRDSAYCSMQGRQRLKIENLIKNHCSSAIDSDADFYFFDSVVLEGNHSANCQSAGSQIDPISFILQRTIWGKEERRGFTYLVLQMRFLLRVFACFKTLQISDYKYSPYRKK